MFIYINVRSLEGFNPLSIGGGWDSRVSFDGYLYRGIPGDSVETEGGGFGNLGGYLGRGIELWGKVVGVAVVGGRII